MREVKNRNREGYIMEQGIITDSIKQNTETDIVIIRGELMEIPKSYILDGTGVEEFNKHMREIWKVAKSDPDYVVIDESKGESIFDGCEDLEDNVGGHSNKKDGTEKKEYIDFDFDANPNIDISHLSGLGELQ